MPITPYYTHEQHSGVLITPVKSATFWRSSVYSGLCVDLRLLWYSFFKSRPLAHHQKISMALPKVEGN